MISRIRGHVVEQDEDYLTIEANGIGYQIFCPGYLLFEAPSQKEEIILYIESHIREDHIHLYGFKTKEERKWFNILQTVKGVGARLALSLIDAMPARKLSDAIISQDKAAFKNISGVGPKIAERIILELKNNNILKNEFNIESIASETPIINKLEVINDAVAALGNLGYSRVNAYNIVTKITANNQNIQIGDIIKIALKEMGAK